VRRQQQAAEPRQPQPEDFAPKQANHRR
jgi:hypothetical protein